VVLDFVKGHIFDPADFVIRADGVCRLNPGGDGFDMESLQAGRAGVDIEQSFGLGVAVRQRPPVRDELQLNQRIS
jgi:hypothetical protein